ncbi:hypothetical protein M758_5G162900 [Ceratodon purpureus]|nr:hypothetical protein M758_5G162900 [Ceratodon purpureus]
MGSGRGAGRGSLESLKRAGRTLFFLLTMIGSLFVSCGPLLVSILDICVLLFAFTCCTSCFSFRADWATYNFRGSLIDIPLLSLGRSLFALGVYALCGIPSLCHSPYLGVTVVSGIGTLVFLSVKASLYKNFHVHFGSPMSVDEHRHKSGLPLLLVLSAVFALVHIIVAYKARCQARRKLCFDRLDSDGLSSSKSLLTGYQRVPRSSSPKFFRRNDVEGNLVAKSQQDDENDLPPHLLADYDSLFMDVNGLRVHYKSTDGSSASYRNPYERHEVPQYFRSLSGNFSTTWNPLIRPPVTGSLHTPVQTPLLSGYSGSPTWRNTAPALNGWPAIMQQTYQVSGDMPSMPSSSRNGEFQGNSSGVVFIHGFGGGVFSWRHVMGTVAREVGCRAVAFDRPGWGLTTRPRRSEWAKKGLPNPYELQTQVDLLVSFCQGLGLTSVVLVGHSDGGLLALLAAAKSLKSRHSTQVEVKGLVLMGTSFTKEVVPSLVRVLLHTTLGRHMLRPLLRSEIAKVTTRRAWHDASKLTSETLDLYKAPLHVENWDKALSEISKAGMTTSVLSASSSAELVRCVANMPALIVAGTRDNFVPIDSAQTLASQLPSSRLVAIPSCGHLPHEECPDALLSAMIPFVARHLGHNAGHLESRPRMTYPDPFNDRID